MVNADPSIPGGPNVPAAVIHSAIDILDDAYFVELLDAPSFGEILLSFVGFAVAVAAVGVGYAARDDQVVSTVAYAIAVVAGLLSVADIGWKIRINSCLGRVVPILIQQWADFCLNPGSEPRAPVGDRSVGVRGR